MRWDGHTCRTHGVSDPSDFDSHDDGVDVHGAPALVPPEDELVIKSGLFTEQYVFTCVAHGENRITGAGERGLSTAPLDPSKTTRRWDGDLPSTRPTILVSTLTVPYGVCHDDA